MTYHLNSFGFTIYDVIYAVRGKRLSRTEKMNGIEDARLASTVLTYECRHPI